MRKHGLNIKCTNKFEQTGMHVRTYNTCTYVAMYVLIMYACNKIL